MQIRLLFIGLCPKYLERFNKLVTGIGYKCGTFPHERSSAGYTGTWLHQHTPGL